MQPMAARQSALDKKLSDAVKLLEKYGYTVTPPAEPVKVDTTELNKRKLEARRNAFIEELRKYQGVYSNDLLNAFYLYWVEPNKTFTKMRFELQRTWSLELRLKTWFNNDTKRYGRKQIPTDTERINKLSEILAG
jgi:hypothetical protein